MKIYGYAKGDHGGTLMEMGNVAICFQGPEHARKFADFANACAEEMLAMGEDYDHAHFAGRESPDITIERLMGTNH